MPALLNDIASRSLGAEIKSTISSPSNWIYLRKNKFHAGEKVKLNIDPDDPKLSHADGERGFLISGILMSAMGAFVVIKIIKTFITKMKHIT